MNIAVAAWRLKRGLQSGAPDGRRGVPSPATGVTLDLAAPGPLHRDSPTHPHGLRGTMEVAAAP